MQKPVSSAEVQIPRNTVLKNYFYSKLRQAKRKKKKKRMDTLSKPWQDLGTPPRYWIRWFTRAQWTIWIIALKHYLPRVAQQVKYNSFHPGQQENYIVDHANVDFSLLPDGVCLTLKNHLIFWTH